jgi:hypothetical protein
VLPGFFAVSATLMSLCTKRVFVKVVAANLTPMASMLTFPLKPIGEERRIEYGTREMGAF